jgi:hypothetical protein
MSAKYKNYINFNKTYKLQLHILLKHSRKIIYAI